MLSEAKHLFLFAHRGDKQILRFAQDDKRRAQNDTRKRGTYFRDTPLSQEAPDRKDHVGGALGQPPHEVREPFFPKGNIDPQAVALLDQPLLPFPVDAVEHLEFKTVFRQTDFARGAAGRVEGRTRN